MEKKKGSWKIKKTHLNGHRLEERAVNEKRKKITVLFLTHPV